MGISYFYDSYAIIEYINDNPCFVPYFENHSGITALPNVMEVYYSSLLDSGKEKADPILEKIWTIVVHPKRETVKKAMQFRAQHKKQKLSYADCLGYALAKEQEVPFLTGDKEFKDFPNVIFLK